MTLPTMRCVFAAAVLAIAGCASTNVSTIPYPNVGDFPLDRPCAGADPAHRTGPAARQARRDHRRRHLQPAADGAGGRRHAPHGGGELGADAAVVVVDTTQPGLAVASGTWWGRTPMSRAAREVIAVAVKYR